MAEHNTSTCKFHNVTNYIGGIHSNKNGNIWHQYTTLYNKTPFHRIIISYKVEQEM